MAKMNNYAIRFIALPYTVKGVTVMDNDGFYNIYINYEIRVKKFCPMIPTDCYAFYTLAILKTFEI